MIKKSVRVTFFVTEIFAVDVSQITIKYLLVILEQEHLVMSQKTVWVGSATHWKSIIKVDPHLLSLNRKGLLLEKL